MRKLAIALALASTALAGPALARDGAFYIGVNGGPMIVEDVTFDIGSLQNVAVADHDYGYDVDGVVGYDFGAFRLEAEVGYREARLDSYRSGTTTFRGPITPGNAVAGTFNDAVGRTSALSFMVNGLLDFGDDDGLTGFIGGGAGVARVKASNYRINPAGAFLNDSDTGFAYQALAGVRAPLSDNVDVSLKYRFFNVDNVNLIGATGNSFNTRFRSHSILGGLTFNFGEPAVALPPPPLPAPPVVVEAPLPPPPVVSCQPGPFIVFFEWDRSEITPEAASILDNAVAAYANCGNAQVELRGFTDTSGTPRYNLGLSQRRSDAVSAYMQSRGIGSGVITTQALGETNLRVQTSDGVRELQNRRVEITYGQGSTVGQ